MFRVVFVSVVIGTALIVAAFVLNSYRPSPRTDQPTADLVKATGGCAECHRNQHYSVVHEYELSVHARKDVNCLQCHQPAAGQTKKAHNGFEIAERLTAGNCRSCHEQVYQEFLRSRHAAPSWGAVHGERDFNAEQIVAAEKHHPGSVHRAANPLVGLEVAPAVEAGCAKCHAVGKPNSDGTIGTCTACHTRHTSSVAVARLPTTCGQCHMGPDHSQLEIYEESKHGVLFHAQHQLLKLDANPKALTTKDMFIPTCATCHMSGLGGQKLTHDTSERLSYFLAAEITPKRQNFDQAQTNMKALCANCHSKGVIDRVYKDGEQAVAATNEHVQEAKKIIDDLRRDKILTGKAFQHPLDFAYFDFWHYYGRTVKHGAFMGGADFVQWHGSYPMLKSFVEIKSQAKDLRSAHGK